MDAEAKVKSDVVTVSFLVKCASCQKLCGVKRR
jgi:hypothetical protein